MNKPNQDTAKDPIDDLARRLHFADDSMDELTDEDIYGDIPEQCLKVINQAKAKIEALITQAHQKGYDAGFNNRKFISDSQSKRMYLLEDVLKRAQEK